MLFGLGVDAFYKFAGISPRAIIGDAAELIPESVKLIAVVVLLGISIKPLFLAIRKKIAAKQVPNHLYQPFPAASDAPEKQQ